MAHIPVLAGAALELLRIRGDGVYVDCTAGAGGHTALLAERVGISGTVVAIDRDPAAVELTRERVGHLPQVRVLQGNYGELGELLRGLEVTRVDGVLIDAGVSSMQLDDAARGFSFQQEGPLDMRMDPAGSQTAAEFLARVEERELSRIFHDYGDLKKARKIAAAICRRRDRAPLRTTHDLAGVVAEVFDFVEGVPGETRTVFQSIRIAVNGELDWLERGLGQAIGALAASGRLVCITFHSGEDRVVKNVMREAARERRVLHPDGRIKEVLPPLLKTLTRRPVVPSEDELRSNPRAHSAKLRAVERLA